MDKPAGFTPEQVKAIRALERAFKLCDKAGGIEFYGIDSGLHVVNVDADTVGHVNIRPEFPEAMSLCLDNAYGTYEVNTSGLYIDSGAS